MRGQRNGFEIGYNQTLLYSHAYFRYLLVSWLKLLSDNFKISKNIKLESSNN